MFSFQETQCERLELIQPSSFRDRFYNSTIVTVLVLCRPPMLTRDWQRQTETGMEWKTCWRKAPSSLFLVFLGMDVIVVQDKTSDGMVVITGQDIVAGPQAERRLTNRDLFCFVFKLSTPVPKTFTWWWRHTAGSRQCVPSVSVNSWFQPHHIGRGLPAVSQRCTLPSTLPLSG